MPDYRQTANDEIATIVLVEKARGREARRARAVTTSGAGQVTDPVCGMRIDPAVPLTERAPLRDGHGSAPSGSHRPSSRAAYGTAPQAVELYHLTGAARAIRFHLDTVEQPVGLRGREGAGARPRGAERAAAR